MINKLEETTLKINPNSRIDLRRKFINKINDLKIKKIKIEDSKNNSKPSLKFTLFAFFCLLSWITFLELIYSSGNPDFEYLFYYGFLPASIFAIGVYLIQYRRYLKNNKTWSKLWQEILEIEIDGEQNSIMDSLAHTVRNLSYQIIELDLNKGYLKGKKWWWYTRIIEISMVTNSFVQVSISYKYPYQVAINEFPNKKLLIAFKNQLVKDLKY